MRANKVFRKCGIGALVVLLLAGHAIAQQKVSAPTSGTSAVLAKVNGVPIYTSQLESIIQAAGAQDNDATRAAVEKQMISGEIVRQAAERANYGDRPEVKEALALARAKAVSELYLRDNAKPAPVTDQQVKARYDQMVAAAGDKEYKPRVISVPDDASASTVLAKLKSGQPFDDVARQYSQASNRMVGGEMGWVTFKTPVSEGQTGGVPLPMAQALTQLKTGEYTQTPLAMGSTRIILKLDAVRATQILSYDKVKAPIRQQLAAMAQQQATDALVSKLTKEAKIEQ